MEILEKIKLILNIATLDVSKDELLTMLIDDAKTEVVDYCNFFNSLLFLFFSMSI